MRALLIAGLLTTVVGCASAPSTTPREYQDEQTAATIKVVADPLVFAQDPGGGRDFLNVYAIDVNRMGAHQQYLAVLQWWPDQGSIAASDASQPVLQLDTPGQTLSLKAVSASARELGIAQQIDPTAPRDARWYYFPISKDMIAQVSKAASMRATLVRGDERVAYELWRDNRAELSELAEALP